MKRLRVERDAPCKLPQDERQETCDEDFVPVTYCKESEHKRAVSFSNENASLTHPHAVDK